MTRSIAVLLIVISVDARGQSGHSTPPAPVAMIYSTDLYSPPDDPDDHFDLATLYSLPEIDVLGIVLDQQRYNTHPQFESSGEIPLQQMFRISARSAPYKSGLRFALKTIDDKCLDQPSGCQGGVALILDLLRGAKEGVTILTVGTERDIAAAYNRNPGLFREKVSRIYLNTGLYGFPQGHFDVNLEKDRNAFLAMMKSGLPVYWAPCFGEDNYETFWQVDQRALLETASLERQNYFLFAFSKDKAAVHASGETFSGEALTFLDRPPDPVEMEKLYSMKRNMWSTASFLHAAGLKIFKDGQDNYVASPGPLGEYKEEVIPWSFTKRKIFIDEKGRVTPGKAGNVELFVFHKDNPQEYAKALESVLRRQFQQTLPFEDPRLPRDQRVANLVGRMTLKEKIGQMQNHAPAIPRLHLAEYDWWNEALHGVARNGVATVFPQAIGMAATWDPQLIRREADVISTEARAKHHEALRNDQRDIYKGLTFWSPNINIFRDPRWGRGQETYGEDPFLTSRIGVAFVKGLQGDDPAFFKTISTPKHFAVHSGPEPLRHGFNAKTRTRDLYETYLPAFEACITEGKAWSVMGAYNRFDGEPCCASHRLLGDFLRGAWNFKGYVVSDCGAINDIVAGHKTAPGLAEASALAVRAGCDLTCGNEYEALVDAVARGLIAEKEIDVSVSRLMDARFRLGMFDRPEHVPYSRTPMSENDTDAHSALALKVAQESIVLLKNSHGALPLKKNLRSIAVVGPTADDQDVLVGNYSGTPSHPVTILQGIRRKVGSGTTVAFARGSDLASDSASVALLDEALPIAKNADQIVAVLGLSPQLEGEEMPVMLEGFSGGDRTSLNLPVPQENLLKALAGLGKPVVLVLTSGSALAVNWADEHMPAIMEAWYPGERGGDAVADVLFGDYNPSGRLPVTFYKSVDDLPSFENYSMAGRTYRFFGAKPLYPFGFGLSYSHFEYMKAKVLREAVGKQDTIRVSVTVKNAGDRDGDEVIQVYLRSKSPRPDDPIKSLKGFVRTHLKHGETRTVVVPVAAHDLRVYDEKRRTYAVVPGTYELLIGASSSDIRLRSSCRILPSDK